MNKRHLHIIGIGIILLALISLGLFGYLSQSHYFGPLRVDCINPGKTVTVEGLSPLGTTLPLNRDSVGWASNDERFYNSLIIRNFGLTDTLFLQYGEFTEPIVIKSGISAITIINFDQNRNYTFLEKTGDIFVFLLKLPWLKYLIMLAGLLLTGLIIFYKRKSLPRLFHWMKLTASKMEGIVSSRRTRWMWSGVYCALILISGLLINNFQKNESQRLIFDDAVNIKHNPDQIDYQTIAANFANNGMFPVNGLYAESSFYNIKITNTGDSVQDKLNYNKLAYIKGFYSLHRFPAYPFFTGLIYKLFGVHPLTIKILQLLIICLIAFCFPLLGSYVWQFKGYVAGLISAPFFFYAVFPLVDSIAPDIFTVGFNFFIIWLYISYRKTRANKILIILAFLAGLSILFKASLMYVLPLMVLDIFWINYRHKPKPKLLPAFLFIFIFICCWGPYNLWSIQKAAHIKKNAQALIGIIDMGVAPDSLNTRILKGEFGSYNQQSFSNIDSTDILLYKSEIAPYISKAGVFNVAELNRYSANSLQFGCNLMSTMHDDYFFMIMLYPINGGLHCHNEYITDGQENDSWVFSNNSFYNNDQIHDAYWAKRVANFYYHNPGKFFSIAYSKIRNISIHAPIIMWSSIMFFIWLGLSQLVSISGKRRSKMLLIILSLLALIALTIDSRTLTVVFPCMIAMIPFLASLRKQVPLPFVFLLLSLIVFPIITVGVPRYTTYYFFPLYLLTGYWLVFSIYHTANLINKRISIKKIRV